MWAVESSAHCVLSLTCDSYSKDSIESLATLSGACPVNSFPVCAPGYRCRILGRLAAIPWASLRGSVVQSAQNYVRIGAA